MRIKIILYLFKSKVKLNHGVYSISCWGVSIRWRSLCDTQKTCSKVQDMRFGVDDLPDGQCQCLFPGLQKQNKITAPMLLKQISNSTFSKIKSHNQPIDSFTQENWSLSVCSYANHCSTYSGEAPWSFHARISVLVNQETLRFKRTIILLVRTLWIQNL